MRLRRLHLRRLLLKFRRRGLGLVAQIDVEQRHTDVAALMFAGDAAVFLDQFLVVVQRDVGLILRAGIFRRRARVVRRVLLPATTEAEREQEDQREGGGARQCLFQESFHVEEGQSKVEAIAGATD